MKKNIWMVAAALALVLGAAEYTIAQSNGIRQGSMMGSGMMGMMGGGMMGQGGQSGMMGSGMTGMMQMMSGQPLSPEHLEQFAKLHGITTEQAKQMTDTCAGIMAGTSGPQQGQKRQRR